jgi:hypothetical protein
MSVANIAELLVLLTAAGIVMFGSIEALVELLRR